MDRKTTATVDSSYLEGEHISDTYITETDTTELENLSHNIIHILVIET